MGLGQKTKKSPPLAAHWHVHWQVHWQTKKFLAGNSLRRLPRKNRGVNDLPALPVLNENTRASLFFFVPARPHTKPRRFFPKNCPGHPPKQPTTQQSFFHLRLPGPTASATLTVGSCKHLGQDIHTHAERWALWPGLKRADRDWGAEDIFPAPPLPGTKKRVKIANKRSPLLTHRTP